MLALFKLGWSLSLFMGSLMIGIGALWIRITWITIRDFINLFRGK